MKKTVLFTFFVFLATYAFATDNILHVRQQFYKAVKNRTIAKQFYSEMKSVNFSSDKTILGYKGMSNMIMAKFEFNPFNKWHYFSIGREQLEKAINEDKNNIELRGLRLSVQSNAPFFLNYSSHIKEDKIMILSAYKNVTDPDLKNRIHDFLNSAKISKQST